MTATTAYDDDELCLDAAVCISSRRNLLAIASSRKLYLHLSYELR